MKAILMGTGLEYLLILSSSTMIPPVPDPFKLHEQDPDLC